jgi:hypothetical protein
MKWNSAANLHKTGNPDSQIDTAARLVPMTMLPGLFSMASLRSRSSVFPVERCEQKQPPWSSVGMYASRSPASSYIKTTLQAAAVPIHMPMTPRASRVPVNVVLANSIVPKMRRKMVSLESAQAETRKSFVSTNSLMRTSYRADAEGTNSVLKIPMMRFGSP